MTTRFRVAAAIIALSAVVAQPVVADDNAASNAEAAFREGKAMFDRGEYNKAFTYLERSAGRNYPPAMNALGFCYQYGRGVKRDYAKALNWYKRASSEGDGTGAYNAGWMHLLMHH